MKKPNLVRVFLILLVGSSAALLSAQSLLDNDFYRAARNLMAQSQQALQDGDYDGAASLAAQAKDQLAKSDEYVAAMALFYRANGWLTQANDRISYAKSIKADVGYKDAYNAAVSSAAAAKAAFTAKDYPKSIDLSKAVLTALANIAPPPVEQAKAPAPAPAPAAQPAGPTPLPEYYTVRLILPLRDCFWRIAGYPFVYNNPWKWRLLYDANKSLLEDPNNPNLIQPGQHFIIPSLAGEARQGDWDPEKTYPPLGASR
jgi:nucleoid-associated protein YgaU